MSRVVALCVLLFGSPLLAAAGPFEPVPPVEPKDAQSPFALRIVAYDGSTNGVLTVDVRNAADKPAVFTPQGLFFVPEVDPDEAPQRLGAVGTLTVIKDASIERHERITVAPGQTVRAQLDVYCIDSHRASPTSSTPFRLGKSRLPKQLVQQNETAAKAAARGSDAAAAPPAKALIQSEVWKNRDAAWVPLDGEGRQEASK